MKYITAALEMQDDIYHILQTTIKTIYPQYYPKEVVDFFCMHHGKEHVIENITSGNMGVLIRKDRIVGVGGHDGNHITGVYVHPDDQKQGCGSKIMDELEKIIVKNYDTAVLEASLSAVCMYEHRGYKTIGHGMYELDHNVKLVYEIMEKNLKNN